MASTAKVTQLKFPEIRATAKAQQLPEDFCWFWSEYPRKEKKGDAFKAWRQVEQILPPIEEVMAAVCKYADKCRHKDAQYVMLPATYLRSWSWDDES